MTSSGVRCVASCGLSMCPSWTREGAQQGQCLRCSQATNPISLRVAVGERWGQGEGHFLLLVHPCGLKIPVCSSLLPPVSVSFHPSLS